MTKLFLIFALVGSTLAVKNCMVVPGPSLGGMCPNGFDLLDNTDYCCPSISVVITATCTDKASNCAQNSGYCSYVGYENFMGDQCAKTCKRCFGPGAPPAPAPPTSTCADKLNPQTGQSDCPRMSSLGYCTNAAYVTLMRDQCPKSCGYCR